MDLVAAGSEALAQGFWPEARALFQEALGHSESPEALEGLSTSTWWLDDTIVTFEIRERAFRLYRERDDRRSAARVATSLALDYADLRGEMAIASGWLQRARRLRKASKLDRTWLAHVV